jgi:hypothetical protein
VRQRVARSRELVATGYKPTVVARIAQISRQAISGDLPDPEEKTGPGPTGRAAGG